jgi:hypothetical protein
LAARIRKWFLGAGSGKAGKKTSKKTVLRDWKFDRTRRGREPDLPWGTGR